MARKVIGPTGSRRRRWWFLLCLVVTVGAGVFFIPGALAVHDTGAFQLDGDASSATQPIGATAPDDWDRVCYEATGNANCGTTDVTTGGGGATAVSWTGDCEVGTGPGFGCVSNNATIYTGGGSKDPSDINDWAWKDASGGLPDKDNLVHAFAARYSLDATGETTGGCPSGSSDSSVKCDVIYFGSDRYDNSGDSQQGFWFLQNEIGFGTNKIGGGTGFSSSNDPEFHRLGDLLVLSDFSNGGTTANIKVYEWDPSCTSAVHNPVAGDCADTNLRLLAASTGENGAECTNTLVENDAFCGIVNPNDTTAVPWSSDYTDKSGNSSTYLNGEFFEAGVNLSTLGLAGECFSTVISETRASDSTDAVLKDFVLGSFAPCEATLATTPGGDTTIGSDGTATVSDSATLSVSGLSSPPAPTGTVDFYLCGPSDGITSCDDTTGTLKATIDWNTADTSVENEYTINSGDVTVSSAGDYCWYATWAGDSNYPHGAAKDESGECFTISPVSPALHTAVSNAGPVVPGTTVHDTVTFDTAPATPSNGVYGTITFNVYGPFASSTPTCTGTPTTSTATVQDGVTSYDSADFSPTAPGYYNWTASYAPDSGDANNNPVSETTCGASNEQFQVLQFQPTLSTAQTVTVTDSATILDGGGGGDLAGTAHFQPFSDSNCTAGNELADQEDVAVSGASPQTADMTTVVTLTDPGGTVYWKVSYSSTNTAQKDIAATCTENTDATITDAPTP